MNQPVRKRQQSKDHDQMDQPPDLIAAVIQIDLDAVRTCLEKDPSCVVQTDDFGNNAIHVCIGGGTSRMIDIMRYIIENSDIDLLMQNIEGDCPLDLATAVNDEQAIDLLYGPTNAQIIASNPDSGSNLKPE